MEKNDENLSIGNFFNPTPFLEVSGCFSKYP
jgi:hypothetical protein